MDDVLTQAREILQRVWGYDDFRGTQGDIVRTVASGQHAMVLMPTGGGKSLCYQVPSLVRPGVGIVVSPLIALMKDQVDTLRQLGVRAAYLNSTLAPSAARAVEHAAQHGQLDLLYIAPERLLLPRTLDLLRQTPVALFAVDEAHCVSQWGHDFRPEYQQLSVLAREFPDIPRLALTATADDRTRADIRRVLSLEDAPEFLSSFDRPNIQYRVAPKEQPKEQLLDFIQAEHQGDAGVVYCLSRKSVEDTAKWLQEQGLPVVAYHAGLTQAERSRAQERFLNDEGVIVVATVAFGMGIDKPNVRFVAHLDLPKSMEGYYQETGRAGRDGLPSTAWMVYGLADVVNVRRMLTDSDAPPDIKRVEAGKLDALLTYCETAACRREVLLAYFGEDHPGPCGNCDTCLNPPTVRDMTREAQMALSAAVRTGNRYGAAYLTDILMGKDNDKNRRHRSLPTYGIGKDHGLRVWRSVLRQLVSLGYLTAGPHNGLTTTAKARSILAGTAPLLLREDTLVVRTPKRVRDAARVAQAVIGDEDRPLFLALRAWRAERAAQLGVPPYVVFSDTALKAIAELRPGSLHTLGTVRGIGEQRLAQYGLEVLQVIRDGVHVAAPRPPGTVQAHEFGLSPVQGARSGVPTRPSGPAAAPAPTPPTPRPPTTEARTPPASDAVEPVVSPPDAEVPHVPEVAPEGPQAAPSEAVTAALSVLRRDLARETGYAAYLIFPNGTLAALAERQPRTVADFAGIAGLGPKRIEAYGDRILAAIEQAVRAPAEATPEQPDRDVPAHAPVTAPPTGPSPKEELISAPPLPQATGTVAERPAASVQSLAAMPPAPLARTAAELLEQVRAALEGDGGILALLEDLAALPELAGGLDPAQARTVLEPLDDARGLLGTLVLLHKRARRQQVAVGGPDPVRKTPEA